MDFLFFNAADTPLFSRNDAESATWTVEEMSLQALFPYDAGKALERGQRVAFTDDTGTVQVFEIRKVRTYEPDHYQEITAEHIAIAELTDEVFGQYDFDNVTASSALGTLLTGTLWGVGTNTASGTSSLHIGMGDVWQDVRNIEKNWNVYITPRITLSASGITGRYLDIAPAGGVWHGVRLSLDKNMDETGVTWDDTNVKTALYGFGRSVEVEGEDENQPLTFADVVWTATASHPAKPSGQTYLEDPTATAAYGRNGRARFGFYQNGDIDDAEVLLQKTWETLQAVSQPDVTIDCMVRDLHRLGYADQPLRLHDTALVEIRPTGLVLAKEIIKLTVDLIDPTATRPTIGTYIPNIIYIAKETNDKATGGGGSGGQTNLEYELTEFDTAVERNYYQISLRAYQRDMEHVENILQQAGMEINAQGVLIYADNNPNMVGAKFNVQANAITSEITDRQNADNALSSRITQTADSITLQVNKKAAVYPQWEDPSEETGATIREGDIWEKTNGIRKWGQAEETEWGAPENYTWRNMYGSEQYVWRDGGWELSSDEGAVVDQGTQIIENEKEITLVKDKTVAHDGQIETLHASLSVEADRITSVVEKTGINSLGENETLYSRITQTADSISLVVNSSTGTIKAASIVAAINDAGSSVILSADHIQLDGNTTLAGKFSVSGGNMVLNSGLSVSGGNIAVTGSGGISAKYFSVGDSGGITFIGTTNAELTNANVTNLVTGLQIVQSGNTYTLQKKTTISSGWVDVGNFSRATTLSDAWSSGTLTVTASPQGNSLTRTLVSGTTTWSGNTATVPIIAQWGSSGQYQESTGKNVYVDASGIYNNGHNGVAGSEIILSKTAGSGVGTETTTVPDSAITKANGAFSGYVWLKEADGTTYKNLRTFSFSMPTTATWSRSQVTGTVWNITCTVAGKTYSTQYTF